MPAKEPPAPAQTPPVPSVPVAQPQQAKPKKPSGGITKILMATVGVALFACFSAFVYFFFIVNHTTKYDDAREEISAEWEDFIAEMYTRAFTGDISEEEVLEDFGELIEDSQGKLRTVACWRVEKESRDDCKDLKTNLGEASKLNNDVMKIYEKDQEEEKEDELEDKEQELSEYISDIGEILAD